MRGEHDLPAGASGWAFANAEADSMTETQPGVCEYSAKHKMDGVPATTTIDCGPVGVVTACQACADFYARMS
jgi:hypothetical protein